MGYDLLSMFSNLNTNVDSPPPHQRIETIQMRGDIVSDYS